MADAPHRRTALAIALGAAALRHGARARHHPPAGAGPRRGLHVRLPASRSCRDGDLDFSDDAVPFDSSMPHTAEGYAHNGFPIGPAVWWSPAFVAGHRLGASARVVTGEDDPAPDGRSWPYELLVVWATLAVGVVGLWATVAACRTMASNAAATVATAGVWLAGPAALLPPRQRHPGTRRRRRVLRPAAGRVAAVPGPPRLLVVADGGARLGRRAARHHPVAVRRAPRCPRRRRGARPPPGRRAVRRAQVRLPSAELCCSRSCRRWSCGTRSTARRSGLPAGEASVPSSTSAGSTCSSVLVSWRHGLFSWHPILLVGVVGLVWRSAVTGTSQARCWRPSPSPR